MSRLLFARVSPPICFYEAFRVFPLRRKLCKANLGGPIAYSKSPAKNYDVRDSLGLNAEERLQKRKGYTILVGLALFSLLMYLAFRKDGAESNLVTNNLIAALSGNKESNSSNTDTKQPESSTS